jgi:hypothetical protein
MTPAEVVALWRWADRQRPLICTDEEMAYLPIPRQGKYKNKFYWTHTRIDEERRGVEFCIERDGKFIGVFRKPSDEDLNNQLHRG